MSERVIWWLRVFTKGSDDPPVSEHVLWGCTEDTLRDVLGLPHDALCDSYPVSASQIKRLTREIKPDLKHYDYFVEGDRVKK